MPARTRFLFSQVQDAFVRVYGPDARTKLDRMGDEGMFPRVGRGGLVKYRWLDISRVVLAMELAVMGTSVAGCARADWKKYDQFCKRADCASRDGAADVFLYLIRRTSDPAGSPPEVVDMSAHELGGL